MKPLSTPTKVYQDDFRASKGNALQAAVASLFGQSLHDVPNFIRSNRGYEIAIRDYYQMKEVNGECVKISLANNDVPEIYNNKICILRGKSPRGEHGHVVVAKHIQSGQFEMLHDPHPDETFLDKSEAFGWCLFFV